MSSCNDTLTQTDVHIDSNDNQEVTSTNIPDYEIETSQIIPYPYTPTTEELTDYYQLELSLGEDWSFRLACELSSEAMSTDYSDQSSDNDSVSFSDENMTKSDDLPTSPLLLEDIEVCAYTTQAYHVPPLR
jgi:hypothetical protein